MFMPLVRVSIVLAFTCMYVYFFMWSWCTFNLSGGVGSGGEREGGSTVASRVDTCGRPSRILFVEDLTEVVLTNLPNFWRLAQAYFTGSLFQVKLITIKVIHIGKKSANYSCHPLYTCTLSQSNAYTKLICIRYTGNTVYMQSVVGCGHSHTCMHTFTPCRVPLCSVKTSRF